MAARMGPDCRSCTFQPSKVEVKPLTVEELDRAEKTILKLVQSGTFPKK